MTPPASPDDGAHEGRVETAQSDVPAATFGHYGKQAVNPLAFLADLLPSKLKSVLAGALLHRNNAYPRHLVPWRRMTGPGGVPVLRRGLWRLNPAYKIT